MAPVRGVAGPVPERPLVPLLPALPTLEADDKPRVSGWDVVAGFCLFVIVFAVSMFAFFVVAINGDTVLVALPLGAVVLTFSLLLLWSRTSKQPGIAIGAAAGLGTVLLLGAVVRFGF